MRKTFEQCTNQGTLINTGISEEYTARELISLAEHRISFWGSIKQKAEPYPSLSLEGHYEIIKELCTAILALDGWKALDHECMFTYLKYQKPELEVDFDYILELKDTRNAIDYRGVMVSNETWENNALKISLTINALKEYLASRLNA